MRRDKLAAGEASSQIYAASESNTTQCKWDLAFLPPSDFIRKYKIDLATYRTLQDGQRTL